MSTEKDLLTRSLFRAYLNWVEWREFWENGIRIDDLESLNKFVWEYGLLRGESSEVRSLINRYAMKKIKSAVLCQSGRSLDMLANKISKKYSCRIHLSYVSKLAALEKPDTFVAMDRFSKNGLVLLNYLQSSQRQNLDYEVFLAAANRAWMDYFEDIKKVCRRHDVKWIGPKFGLRILDCYLMDIGGRWE